MNDELFSFENDAPEEENQKVTSSENGEKNDETNDDYIIGSGFVIDETETEDEYQGNDDYYYDYEVTPEQRKKNIKKTVIWVVCLVVAAVILAVGIIFVGADYLGIGFGRGKTVTVDIPRGSSTAAIAEKLEDSGAVKFPFLFRVYSKLKNYDGKYKYGLYTFDNEAGYESLAGMLMNEGAKADSVKVKIPEGATVDDIKKLLADAGVCTEEDFLYSMNNDEFEYDFIKDIPTEKLYYKLEGYLYPDTYDFYSYDSEECAYLAINTMLKNLDNKLTDSMRDTLEKGDYSFHEVMSLASVIQLEAGNLNNVTDADRAKVAAVFYNRIEGINWKQPKFLQSDPTTYYPYGNGKYNTYKTEGIPVGPLCSPSIDCIKAAIDPDRSCKAVYFVTDKAMKFYYNETLSGHNKTVADLKKAGNWVYSALGS